MVNFIIMSRVADVNECLHITSLCENGECVNNDGSYRCKCKMGYQLDETGKKCVGEYKNRMPTVSDLRTCLKLSNQDMSFLVVDNKLLNVDRLLGIIGI